MSLFKHHSRSSSSSLASLFLSWIIPESAMVKGERGKKVLGKRKEDGEALRPLVLVVVREI